MHEPPVVVVGAGLAGLACATELTRSRLPVVVLEASDRVGGRIRTDVVDGFTVDAGFQVLNTAYPALGGFVTFEDLDLRRFPRGVRVRRDGRLYEVPHPLSSPTAPLRALGSGITGLRGKVALGRYAAGLLASSPDALKRRTDVPAARAWGEQLPVDVAADVVTPFMAGVVLDPAMQASRIFTDLMMRLFAHGYSAVPSGGMQRLPEAIASVLPAGTVRLESRVVSASGDAVELEDGTIQDAAAVVVATDPWAAPLLVPDTGPLPETHGVTTYFFAAARRDQQDGTLCVDADRSGVANSVVLTATAPEYSSDGRALIATSVFHDDGRPVLDAAAVEAVARELHPATPGRWELVATRDVPQALPAMRSPLQLRKQTWFPERRVWVAGDHRDTSSIQGALVSGRRVARQVRHQLGHGKVGPDAA